MITSKWWRYLQQWTLTRKYIDKFKILMLFGILDTVDVVSELDPW